MAVGFQKLLLDTLKEIFISWFNDFIRV